MKLAVQLYSLRVFAEKNGAEETLKLVSEAGYDGVEFAGFYGKTPAEMKELVEKYDLQPVSAHIGAEAIEESLPYIDELGIKYVFIPWVAVEVFGDEKRYANLLRITARVKSLLDARGVVLGYHNHAHEFEGGNDYMKKFVSDAGITAETDVFWLHVGGKDPVSYMKDMGDKLAAVHIKEAAGGDAAKLAQPVVGEGVVDMPGVFAQAKAQGVEWAILEVEQYPCGEKEYLEKSLQNMRRFAN